LTGLNTREDPKLLPSRAQPMDQVSRAPAPPVAPLHRSIGAQRPVRLPLAARIRSCREAADRPAVARSALRGDANLYMRLVWWRRTGGSDGAPVGRAQPPAQPTGAQPLKTHAWVRVVPGVHEKAGPELQGVLEADLLRVRDDVHRGWLAAVSATHHDGQDRRLNQSSAVPICTPQPSRRRLVHYPAAIAGVVHTYPWG
jgi:hypothetical protein